MPKDGQKSALPTGLRKVVAARVKLILTAHGIEDEEMVKELVERVPGLTRTTAYRLLNAESIKVDMIEAVSTAFRVEPHLFLLRESGPDKELPKGVVKHSVSGYSMVRTAVSPREPRQVKRQVDKR